LVAMSGTLRYELYLIVNCRLRSNRSRIITQTCLASSGEAAYSFAWATLGLPVICIDARHAKAALKMQINKSDRNDAVGIARIMQCGWYKERRPR
jgi:transposase